MRRFLSRAFGLSVLIFASHVSIADPLAAEKRLTTPGPKAAEVEKKIRDADKRPTSPNQISTPETGSCIRNRLSQRIIIQLQVGRSIDLPAKGSATIAENDLSSTHLQTLVAKGDVAVEQPCSSTTGSGTSRK